MANQLACVLPAVHQTVGMVRMARNTICINHFLAFTVRNDVCLWNIFFMLLKKKSLLFTKAAFLFDEKMQ